MSTQHPDLNPLPWVAALETGIAEIDADHREVIELYEVLTALAANGAAAEDLHSASQTLLEHCLQHFRREEAILRRARFPRFRDHVEAHRQFARRLSELVARLEAVARTYPEHVGTIGEMGRLLIELLFRHDLDYKSHLLNSQGR